MSASVQRETPQLPPTFAVHSPPSPPRSQERSLASSRNGDGHIQGGLTHHVRQSASTSVSTSVPPRPMTPKPSPSTPSIQPARLSPNGPSVDANSLSVERKLKSTSLPPPANRATKPKIPVKPPTLSQTERNTLAPQQERASFEDHVSPFSTPPSSPEKGPPKPMSTEKVAPRPLPARPIPEPPTRRSFEERPSAAALNVARDLRDHSSPRSRPLPEPSRATKPLMVQIPASTPVLPESSTAPPISIQRPPPSKEWKIPPSANFPLLINLPPPRTPGHRPLPPAHQFAEPPKTSTQYQRHKTTNLGSQPPPFPERRIARTDTEEEEAPIDEPAVPLTDYPDASQANRRPPFYKTGPKEIPTRYDTRVLDVCGKYVCTTGYLTRVWDLTTGELLMTLGHGETVKSLSIAFKPGNSLEEEGQRFWLGTSAGDLHEVDIKSQMICSSRSYPSRREVIKILRHKKEMWTLDDEGRLLVWMPDETGTPNLQYSYHNPPERVARGHTFSMVVDDTLWLAAGKDVYIYRPDAKDEVSFKVLKRPISMQSEVTSGAYTTKDGGRVYLGHADGKVTISSSTDYSCLGVVNVSVYKINCLGFVGNYLWAAYKTGMIYVYDVKTNPWTVKKDWRAHSSPVCGFVLDSSSVWTMNRLQVTSLGLDNCIRLWDGMLEDDWIGKSDQRMSTPRIFLICIDARMSSKDVEFCQFREIRAAVVTWNAGASTPGSLRTSDFFKNAIHPEDPPEIIVFGFQELVDLENKKITAKSLLMSGKKKETGEKEHTSRQYRVWIDYLTRVLHECMPLDESYVLLHSANMVGLFTCIFVKHKERHNIKSINASEIKRGMGGLHGNKGALIFRFVLDDSSMCFVNCHLAAGQTQTAHRNTDIAQILEAECLPHETNLVTRIDQYASGGDGSMIMDHEICILNGDLNYRIDAIPRPTIINAIRQNNLAKLLERDQLLASRRKNPGFRLRSFTEAPITFAPTYKYDVGSDEYDSSEKKRSPAWCDRILYRGFGRIKQLEYRRHEVYASDHRPVSASFKIRVKTVLPQKRAAVWDVCQQEFQDEKRRLASEAR
ncbi:hypothetical protein N7468_007846 [Penicillium chermesinum]|uniref:Inositol polyphosphate-related phosphatase domain-containing protein n=1 Tax=Penicillium chermesinum TaxID=63820 RepID=A0A9W9NNM4_9EURO|nr:uncharacterized protein N7468_007846 [Penicillium chermesinum]KAJ5223304.1 hypothetical protein N7468_007846 [Penicillium chermesinum]